MIPETQLNVIKVELQTVTSDEIRALGTDKMINLIMKRHKIKKTPMNVNTLRIVLKHKKS